MQDLMEIIIKVKRIDGETKLAQQEFEVAVESNDVERMETARVKLHEHLDLRLDTMLEIEKIKQKGLVDLFKKFDR